MSFYIYQLVEPLILSNTSISSLAICHQSLAINYQSSVVRDKLSSNSSAIRWFYQTEPSCFDPTNL